MGAPPSPCLLLLCCVLLPYGEAARIQQVVTSATSLQAAGTLKRLMQLVEAAGVNSSAPQPDATICGDLRDVTNTSSPQLREALAAWPHGKLWASGSFNAKWLQEVGLRRPPGFSQSTSFQDLMKFIGGEQPLGVTVKGGAVRDLFLDGVLPTDIDIGWSRDKGELAEAFRSEFSAYCDNPEGEWGEEFQYLQFGIREAGPGASVFDPLEGNNKKAFSISECKPENSANALEFEPTQEVIIDPTGFGVADVCKMHFRLPPDCSSAEKWVSTNGGQTVLRFYKMYQKGFKLADQRDLVFLFQSLELQARNAVDGQDQLRKEAKEFFVELKRDSKRLATKAAKESLDKEMKQAVLDQIDAIGADFTQGYTDAMKSLK